ncbi:MAG: glycosyltransferase family 4 protein [Candidatus Zambryskibacteria bacterium]|nr:glycosyltransferase family 4 protein [Candidatus Zambryskibacteria bacterium]
MLHDDWKDRFISKNSDSLITTSEKLKKSLLEIGVPSEKALVVYGGVNLADFGNVDSSATKKKYGIPTDKVLIGYIGLFRTMGMEKGIDIMIRSLKFLNQDTLMVFVGGKKNEVSAYETLAGEIGVRNQCIFIEKIPDQKEIFNIEQAMNVLVIPYPDRPHFRNYGFPMKVYEYMAAEKPIVYSKLDLTEEILKDCGFTFVPDSEVSLADTIKYVISEENLGEVSEKATLAYEKLKEFTWENKARKIIEFLQRNG